MKVVAVIQARMTSSRLPGKVLADLAGAPVLARVVERLRGARQLSEVVVACTDQPADDPIEEWATARRIPVVRGSETDVLGRFVRAALSRRADAVVRVTADCPLIDPLVTDRVVDELLTHAGSVDYVSNVLERSYPRGLDVEAFFLDTLLKLDRVGRLPEDREHVTLALRRPGAAGFVLRSIRAERDDSDLRWTVDTPDDLTFMRELFGALAMTGPMPSYERVVTWCRAHPEQTRRDDSHLTWDPIRL
jgi:spore coat polysaccharide biosynthesis protein SpsF